MTMYLTRFSWPGWCVSAHGLADGELLHVPLLPAGCCYAGTGDNSADTFWKVCVGRTPWKQAVAHSSCSRWLSRWTTMWRCSTVRWRPNTTHPHLIMCTLRHVQCFNYIQCTTYVAYYLEFHNLRDNTLIIFFSGTPRRLWFLVPSLPICHRKLGFFSHQCCQSNAELRSNWYSKCGFSELFSLIDQISL